MISIGSDHAGLELKKYLKDFIENLKLPIIDVGCFSPSSVDYPDFGKLVAEAVSKGSIEKGILICGTGLGMSIVANKFKNVRATLCNDVFSAKKSRYHNDSNILVLAGRLIGKDLAKEIVNVWLTTKYDGGRHQHRIDKIHAIELEQFK
jgi:ribose 5-phosphate isomerase B